MYITNLDQVLPALRGRLVDFLSLKLDKELNPKSRFPCFVHQGEDDNMAFNPKTNHETVHCFVCGVERDIFSAASELSGLVTSGPQWVTETIPTLCDLLDVPYERGAPSAADAEKMRIWSIARDIEEILKLEGTQDYAKERNWLQDDLVVGSIDETKLISSLVKRGWDVSDINRSLLVKTSSQSFFGTDRTTFVIKDERGRACGFVSRNTSGKGPKYINTPESLAYQKGKVLLGLDTALHHAKQHGLYIVEGPGDLAQLKRVGVYNSAATCGTALTPDHLLLLRAYGIRNLYLSLDWDEAGVIATERIIHHILRQAPGMSVSVVMPPKGSSAKDLDELLKGSEDSKPFAELETIPAFDWAIQKLSDNEPADSVCAKMVPIIASEMSAVRRELLIKKLADFAGFSFVAISNDVNAIRNKKFEERKERLLAAAEQYKKQVDDDPDNITAIMAQHEMLVERIEKEFNKDQIGATYQVGRYEAVQTLRDNDVLGTSGFAMSWFPSFAQVLGDGASWTSGCLMYVGGRANCFAKDTLFWSPITKTKVTADRLACVDSVDAKTKTASVEAVIDYIDSGVQECFEVKTSAGFSVTTTAEHRYLTQSGWKRLSEISVGEKIAAPIRSGFFGQSDLGVDRCELVGLMIGDGNITQPRPLFTNCDPMILARASLLISRIFGEDIQIPVYMIRKENEEYRMVGFTQKDWKTNRNDQGYCHPNPVTTFFKELDLYGKRAWEKTIPEKIMNGSREEVAACLRGLWSTDGSIYVSEGRARMEYSCTSEKLTSQIQELLYKFGIPSRVFEKVSKSNPVHWKRKWKLVIDHKPFIKKYLSEIGFIEEKQSRVSSDLLTPKKHSGTRDVSGDIIWVKISSIRSVGMKETCDITVANTHSFCIPGFVLHNSGKTATVTTIGTDVAMTDEDAIVLMHMTDDSYEQIEPRITSIIARMLYPDGPSLSIGDIVRAGHTLKNGSAEQRRILGDARACFTDLLKQDRLVLIDSEDGATLSTLEKNLRYYRQHYPSKKILMVCDKAVLSPSS